MTFRHHLIPTQSAYFSDFSHHNPTSTMFRANKSRDVDQYLKDMANSQLMKDYHDYLNYFPRRAPSPPPRRHRPQYVRAPDNRTRLQDRKLWRYLERFLECCCLFLLSSGLLALVAKLLVWMYGNSGTIRWCLAHLLPGVDWLNLLRHLLVRIAAIVATVYITRLCRFIHNKWPNFVASVKRHLR
ncbi:hypothetical protein GGR53DRAFT_52001 [Hypoxylon sp. FL1150]|nr:hypothetical protein GGR53DRAFT_52001 [Hypoxylon sp. FL1150]